MYLYFGFFTAKSKDVWNFNDLKNLCRTPNELIN